MEDKKEREGEPLQQQEEAIRQAVQVLREMAVQFGTILAGEEYIAWLRKELQQFLTEKFTAAHLQNYLGMPSTSFKLFMDGKAKLMEGQYFVKGVQFLLDIYWLPRLQALPTPEETPPPIEAFMAGLAITEGTTQVPARVPATAITTTPTAPHAATNPLTAVMPPMPNLNAPPGRIVATHPPQLFMVVKPQQQWVVYFITEEPSRGVYKVGFTGNLAKRLSQLQTGNPSRLRVDRQIALGSRQEVQRLEAVVHRILQAYRVAGEWFALTPKEAEILQTTIFVLRGNL